MLNFHLKISLKLKITFAFVFMVLVMMAIVTYIFTIRQQKIAINEVQLRMERLARNIATIRSVETQDWSIYQNYIENQLRLNPDIVYIAIEDDQGNLRSYVINTEWIQMDEIIPPTETQLEFMVRRLIARQVTESSQRDLESKSVNIMLGSRHSGTVKVGFSLVALNDALQTNLTRNLVLGLIFTLLGIWIAFYISNRIVKPLSKLTAAMSRIIQGDLDQEIESSSKDEIGTMAQTFNFMAHGLREKKVIEDFTRELGTKLELRTVSSMIRDRITYAFQAKKGLLLLRDQTRGSDFFLVDVDTMTDSQEPAVPCESNFLKDIKGNPVPRTLGSLSIYPNFYKHLRSQSDWSDTALVAPMLRQDYCLGLFIFEPPEGVFYDDKELAFLTTLISQGVMAIENALLLEELTEKERLKRELEIAQTIQKSLLPNTKPVVEGLDIDGCCLPAAEVGGDYFDFFKIGSDKIGIVIADVTGKGTSAAFYMAVVKGLMLSLTQNIQSPKSVLSELNHLFWGQMDRKIFVTMIYGVLNHKTRTCTFSRAGHNGLIFQKAGDFKVDYRAPKGIGLGLEEGPVFDQTIEEERIQLQSGDRLLFYTDGAFEARNQAMEEFGEDRLISLFSDSDESDSASINKKLLNGITNFISNAAPHDDITLITVKAL